jgi:hypothetical protein
VPCCPDHDLGSRYVELADLRKRWRFWLEHFEGMEWRGDRALTALVEG